MKIKKTILAVILFSALSICSGFGEECPNWEITPPVLCEETPNIFDTNGYGVNAISGHELIQQCKDGTSVLWIWNGLGPKYKKETWVPVCSFTKENSKIYFDCLVKGENSACKKYTDKVNEIVDCRKEKANAR